MLKEKLFEIKIWSCKNGFVVSSVYGLLCNRLLFPEKIPYVVDTQEQRFHKKNFIRTAGNVQNQSHSAIKFIDFPKNTTGISRKP